MKSGVKIDTGESDGGDSGGNHGGDDGVKLRFLVER